MELPRSGRFHPIMKVYAGLPLPTMTTRRCSEERLVLAQGEDRLSGDDRGVVVVILRSIDGGLDSDDWAETG